MKSKNEVMKPDRRSIDEKNAERLALLKKRAKQELSAAEEATYKRLHRAVMRYTKKKFPHNYDDVKALGRSRFTPMGRMVRAVRKRRSCERQ